MAQNYIITGGELYHYGVPGMKWGKRKAIKKLSRYERKYQMYQDRADKYNLAKTAALEGSSALRKTANNAAPGASGGTIGRAKALATRSASRVADRAALKIALKSGAKAAKAQMKADKWKKKLDKVAEKKNIDLGKGTVDQYLLRQISG